MIISRRWLAKYVQLDIDDAALNKALTFSGMKWKPLNTFRPCLPSDQCPRGPCRSSGWE
jgi:hypothetical protein